MCRRWPVWRKNLCPLPMPAEHRRLHFPPWQSWPFTSHLGRWCSWGLGKVLEGSGLSLVCFFCLLSVLMRFTSPLIGLWALGLKLTLLGNHYVCKFWGGGGIPGCIARHWNAYLFSAWRDYALLEPEEVVFLFFWSNHVAVGISIRGLGIKPIPSVVDAWNLNHWTTREAPKGKFLNKLVG